MTESLWQANFSVRSLSLLIGVVFLDVGSSDSSVNANLKSRSLIMVLLSRTVWHGVAVARNHGARQRTSSGGPGMEQFCMGQAVAMPSFFLPQATPVIASNASLSATEATVDQNPTV